MPSAPAPVLPSPATAAAASPARRPRVLFVGDDASSAEIAANLVRHVAGDAVAVDTANTSPVEPGGRSDELLVAMGLDPAADRLLSARSLRTADRVVVLGAHIDVARLPGPRYEEWDLTREDLLTRVEALSDELTAVPTVAARPSLTDRVLTLLGALRRR
jgi:arsenate reductase